MATPDSLVDRLAALPRLKELPRSELEWLVAHGKVESAPAGKVVGPKGVRFEDLWILLSGIVTTQVERPDGPRWVADRHAGDATGRLPYSRMVGPPGDVYAAVDTEGLVLSERLFPEMVQHCPKFTASTVHQMIDRARAFKATDLQHEKMVSLGKLAAGLAHELNNPASAAMRAASQLLAALGEADAASRALGAAGLTDEMAAVIEQTRSACLAHADGTVRSPLEQADHEDAIADWLARHHADPAHAVPLSETSASIETLDALAATLPPPVLDAALRWIAVGCTTQALAVDIEQSGARIRDLVAAVKRFTYMDAAAGPGPVDVTVGLRDTARVLAAKARSRGAGISFEIEPDLPKVRAIGSELNQVWLNLLDNALDVVPNPGRVTLSARREGDRVVVRVVDDGPGIPPEVLPQIFDPFYTTKPPGQGTGLGLEITRRLVRQSNGDIAVDSHPGRTEFRVSLAAQESDA